MKFKDILNIRVDVFKDSVNSGYRYYTTTIRDFISKMVKYKVQIEELRELNKRDEKAAKEAKKHNFIACTPSAIFNRRRVVGDVKEKTGLIAIDIDKDKNPFLDVEKAKQDVIRLPFVALTMLSIRGGGIWCLIPYNKENYIGYVYNALEKEFKNLGYTTDKSCSDITRLRYISYDDNILINEDVQVYEDYFEKPKTEYNYQGDWELTKDDIKSISTIIYVLVKYFNYSVDDYNEWLYEGFRLATIPSYDVGLKLFQFISEHSDNYKGYEDVEEKFNECRNTTVNTTNVLGYYINKVKEIYGLDWRYRINDLLKGKAG